jgi:hypothetical protein
MPGPQPKPPVIRFWPKVDRSGGPDACWLWTAGAQGSGYGQFYPSKGRPTGAHRFSWELANGRPIPPGMHVMHSCDVRLCVNPAHLSIGTAADNNQDKSRKGRNPGNRTDSRRQEYAIRGTDLAFALRLHESGWTPYANRINTRTIRNLGSRRTDKRTAGGNTPAPVAKSAPNTPRVLPLSTGGPSPMNLSRRTQTHLWAWPLGIRATRVKCSAPCPTTRLIWL